MQTQQTIKRDVIPPKDNSSHTPMQLLAVGKHFVWVSVGTSIHIFSTKVTTICVNSLFNNYFYSLSNHFWIQTDATRNNITFDKQPPNHPNGNHSRFNGRVGFWCKRLCFHLGRTCIFFIHIFLFFKICCFIYLFFYFHFCRHFKNVTNFKYIHQIVHNQWQCWMILFGWPLEKT